MSAWEAYHLFGGDLGVIPRENVRRKLKGKTKQGSYGSHGSPPGRRLMANMTSNHEAAECAGSHASCESDHTRSSNDCVVTMPQADDDLSYLYVAFFGSRQEIVSEAFGTRGESGWGHLGCKIWCDAVAAH